MANKMLIDTAHPEETRVVVVRGNRVEEFDFESQSRKQLRGNIYLAKVTRVEPSLQAAFVEYGGNRQGFLAFSEIHPDYYQIPVADREALLAEEARMARDEDDDNGRSRNGKRRRFDKSRERSKPEEAHFEGDDSVAEEVTATTTDADTGSEQPQQDAHDDDHHDDDVHEEEEIVESVGAGDAYEDMPERRSMGRKQYKIQEVIKRRQVMLVQVVKEERGNKGAALTTYLSLAGRYSVLMPNTARGGGISRKITNATDRKKLKTIASDLDVPEGMGVILRTAGANRTKTEIKRDFEYLLRLWENVRDLTLQSAAPNLVYEEGSLIKRSIRDLYNKDIEEVLVSGENGYKEAKDFMRMLMPSHAKNVKPYRDPQPMFNRLGVETQLDAMFSNIVQLKSGGYIVLNQTEALVAIDVNSGRATREHNIEDTALKTNCEAAEEIARQLRLRDLAGLVVCDFIDMNEKRNNRTVERKLKDALKNDRARIQVGRISHFGLLEMSRQRIRTGVLESSTEVCPHCGGTGHVRSVSSVALYLLRQIEDNLLRSGLFNIIVRARPEVALYVLNHKRANLAELEARFRVLIEVVSDHTVSGQHMFAIERGLQVHTLETAYRPPATPLVIAEDPEDELIVDDIEDDEDEDEADEGEAKGSRSPRDESEEGERNRKRRRRRRRRGRRDDEGENGSDENGSYENGSDNDSNGNGGDASDGDDTSDADGESESAADGAAETAEEKERRRRRRGRRGGRRNKLRDGVDNGSDDNGDDDTSHAHDDDGSESSSPVVTEDAAPVVASEAPVELISETVAEGEAPAAEEAAAEEKPKKPRARRTTRTTKAKAEAAAEDSMSAPETKAAPEIIVPEAVTSAPVAPPPPAPEVVEAVPVDDKPSRRRLPDTPVEELLTPVEETKPRRFGWWSKKG